MEIALIQEKRFVFLSDGLRITESGALGEDTQVEDFDLLLLAFDVAGKYRGFSFNSELFFRWIENISGSGQLSHEQLFALGAYGDVGYMVIPKRLELVGRVSTVDGEFRTSWEYA